MKNKRIILTAIFLVLTGLLLSVVTGASGGCEITVEGVTAKAGDTVEVDVVISGNPGIAGMIMGISYDTDALTLNSVKNGTVMSGMVSGKNIVLTNTPQSEKNGVLLTLSFTVSETASAGAYTVKCNVYECSNSEENTVSVNSVSGAVTVPAPACEHTYGDWYVSRRPGLHNNGELRRNCTKDHTHVEAYRLPTLGMGHYQYESMAKADCEHKGRDRYRITLDGQSFDFEMITPALGHRYGAWVEDLAPTYSKHGEKHRICERDGHREDDRIDRLQAMVTPNFNNSTGSASATVNRNDVNILDDDDRVAVNTSSGNEGVVDSVAGLTPEFVEAVKDKELEVSNDLGTIILDTVSTEKLHSDGGHINIGIKNITSHDDHSKGKMVFSITVDNADGNPMFPPEQEDKNGTITLCFTYKKGLHKDWIRIAYIDEHGNREYREVKDYDPKTGRVSFDTRHLSDYEISGIELPELTGMYLNLTDNINANYTAKVPEGFTDPYMIFEMLGNEYKVEAYTLLEDGRYSYCFESIGPQYMGENISATLYATKDGVEYSVTESETSIRGYCINTLEEHADDESLVKLLSDLLVYGEKAQIYAGYDVENLVTSGLALNPTVYSEPTNTLSLSGSIDETADWVGFGLMFDGMVNSYLTFSATDIEGLLVNVSVNGREVSYAVSQLETLGENKYKVYLEGIYAYELDDIITASFTRNGTDIGRTMTYSVKTYACYLDSITASDDLSALAKAVCNYGYSAYQYYLETEGAK